MEDRLFREITKVCGKYDKRLLNFNVYSQSRHVERNSRAHELSVVLPCGLSMKYSRLYEGKQPQ